MKSERLSLSKRRLWNPKRHLWTPNLVMSEPVEVVLVQPKDEILLEEPQVKKTEVKKKEIMLVNMSMIQNFRMTKFIKLFGEHSRTASEKGLKTFQMGALAMRKL